MNEPIGGALFAQMVRESPQRVITLQDDSRIYDIYNTVMEMAEKQGHKYLEIEKNKFEGFHRIRAAFDKVPYSAEEI